jgi:hypothetical protein
MEIYLLLIKHHDIKTYWKNEGIAPLILNIDTRWRSEVSFMPRSLYLRRGGLVIYSHINFSGVQLANLNKPEVVWSDTAVGGRSL